MKQIRIFLILFSFSTGNAQSIITLTSGTNTSLRGLSVVNNKVIWVCGSNGMVGVSGSGGQNWKWIRVPNFEKTDFRDIKAFDDKNALILGVGEPGYILQTIDGGDHWKTVYVNKRSGIFLDAFAFWNNFSGIAIGDPINKKFVIARTYDGGNNWTNLPPDIYPDAFDGEACFAASGTNIAILGDQCVFVTGGSKSRIFMDNRIVDLPLIQGKSSCGAYSIAIKNNKTFIVVGGDYTLPASTEKNCAVTTTGGLTWTLPATPPSGYRSCVEYIFKKKWVTCGTNGVDYSTNDGNTWKNISSTGFNVCRKAKKGSAVFFAGANGSVAYLKW